jgi:hypothetical protein
MILHTPEIRHEGGVTRVSARLEFQRRIPVPDTLWFTFPETYGKFCTGRSDAFAASLLLLAMLYGEDMEVRGLLSQRLVHGMEEYQRIFLTWLPKRFKAINIRSDNYGPPVSSDFRGGVACAFSGGVDSFYTLWSHLPQNEPKAGFRLTHALFIHGYDIPLSDELTYSTALHNYDTLMRALGLELISAKTNIYEIVTPTVSWEWAHGSALIGVALNLDQLIGCFYVPSTHTYADAIPWGSDPRLDYLLSTEAVEIFHDGATVTRTEKTATIAQWSETYSRLRVCWERPDGLKNCCRCSKCVRTMTALDLVQMLPRYTTFPIPLTRQGVRRCKFLDENERGFVKEVIDSALARGKRATAFDLRYALFRSRISSWFDRIRSIPAVGSLRSLARRFQAVTTPDFGKNS